MSKVKPAPLPPDTTIGGYRVIRKVAAGGFGLLGGTTPDGAEGLRAMIRAVRERTARPFGVGFISSYPGLAELVPMTISGRSRLVLGENQVPDQHVDRDSVTVRFLPGNFRTATSLCECLRTPKGVPYNRGRAPGKLRVRVR